MRKLPSKIKQIKGTYRKCRENQLEPEFILLSALPDPPIYLSEKGRQIYYSTAKELQEKGLLNGQNFNLFVMYVIELATYFEAREQLSKSPILIKSALNEPRVNPYFKIMNQSLMNSLKIGVEFGLTPVSQSKVSAQSPAKDPKLLKLQAMETKNAKR